MDYKVLVKVHVPEIERIFEVYIPVNRTVGEVTKLLNGLLNESTDGVFPIKENIGLCNRITSETYEFNKYIRDTNIRNGTQLVLY